MLTREEIGRRLRDRMPYLKDRYGVVRIALYGSFVNGNPTEKSDVDLLVELSESLGLEFVALADEIETALGRKVDLATFETLKRSLDKPRHRRIALNIERTLTDVCTAA